MRALLDKGDEADKRQPTPRRDSRDRVLKSGKIIFDNTVFDCVVLDISPYGARVKLGTPVPLPPEVMLRLRDGTTYPATRRWSRGDEIGLEFTGTVISSGDAIHGLRADEARKALRDVNLAACLAILEAERFFGDEGLRRSAETASAALDQLLAALKPHIARVGRKPPENGA